MHIPMRMCIACRQMKPQKELLRITHDKSTGSITIDTEKKFTGRGAYVCKNAECIGKAKKKNALARHFKCAVPEDVYDVLDKSLREIEKG